MADLHFDGITENFNQTVYKTSRGYVRLGVLWEDLDKAIPEIKTQPLHILDVGGGMGQITLKLAQLGHTITLTDPSKEMLSKAHKAIQTTKLHNVSVICSDAQNLHKHITDTFDIVMCHAVLEWVASPGDVIQALAGFVKPAGKLSLMFLNHNSRVLKRILGGDFTSYLSPKNTQETLQQPAPETFSEAKGLHEEHVRHLLADYGFVVRSKAGIRIFHDHIPEHLRELDLPALLELEKNYRATEPFASLARHIHLICQRITAVE
jgi:S-adenosylmethionine-dependent methyltransferase